MTRGVARGRRRLAGRGAMLALLFAGIAAGVWAIVRNGWSREAQVLSSSVPPDAAMTPSDLPAGHQRDRAGEGIDTGERRRETLTYLTGYGAALALTLAAFAVVVWPVAAFGGTFAIILGLALVQLVVQFRCFLHVSFARSARAALVLGLKPNQWVEGERLS